MRVIAGRFGGRRLADPPGRGVRPTSDRVREALFSALGDLAGRHILDVYAGTGALGIEALSRGAASAVFVERARASLRVLRSNLESLGLGDVPEIARVVRGDAPAVMRRLGRDAETFDLVFLDPPYASDEARRALEALVAADLVSTGGEVVVEASRRHPVPIVPGLALREERRYGETVIVRLEPGDSGRQVEAEPA